MPLDTNPRDWTGADMALVFGAGFCTGLVAGAILVAAFILWLFA